MIFKISLSVGTVLEHLVTILAGDVFPPLLSVTVGLVVLEEVACHEHFITEVTLVGDITMLDSFMVLGTAD